MYEIEGYASVFGNADSFNEVVDRGAFSKWLAANPGQQVPILYQHDYRSWMPVGMTTSIAEDRKGLKFAGVIDDQLAHGGDLVRLMDAGVLDHASFAYVSQRSAEYHDDAGRLHLAELGLHEISVVFRGANAKAYAVPKGRAAPARVSRKAESEIHQPSAAEVAAYVGECIARR